MTREEKLEKLTTLEATSRQVVLDYNAAILEGKFDMKIKIVDHWPSDYWPAYGGSIDHWLGRIVTIDYVGKYAHCFSIMEDRDEPRVPGRPWYPEVVDYIVTDAIPPDAEFSPASDEVFQLMLRSFCGKEALHG